MRRTVLRQLYDESLGGLPTLGTPEAAAREAQRGGAGPREAARALVQRYALLSGAAGFVCGLPGYFTMPVTIPANLAGVALLQLHLCAAVASLAGRDPEDTDVRQRALACVLDTLEAPAPTAPDEQDEREGLLRRLAGKVGERGMRFAGEQVLSAVGKGARSLPLLGGAVGGFSDARSTQAVGRRARRAFLDKLARQ